MKHILVPVGSSANAQSHLQYAIDFAEAFGAKVYVVQTYNVYTKAGTLIKVDQIIQKESEEFLKRLVSSVNTKNVEVLTRSFKGDLVETLELIYKKFDIDLVIIEPKTNSIKEEEYLGKTSGKIVKQTNIPALIVPEGAEFKPYSKILMALKSAVIKKERVLDPLKQLKERFNSVIDLLLVATKYHKKEDFEINSELGKLISSKKETSNPTTYQGVLEHYQSYDPDLIVVVRRKRGFFTKLWEKNTILKKDFYIAKVPVLVLREPK